MRNVSVVVGREYLQRVRRRSFVISTIAVPVILLGFLIIPAVMGAREAAADSRIALVDRTGLLAEGLAERLEEGGFRVEVVEPGSPGEDAARARAAAGELAGILELDEATLTRGAARWIGESPPSTIRGLGIRQAVSQSALEDRLRGTVDGEGVAALLGGGSLEVVRLDAGAAEDEGRAGALAAGFFGGFLLYFVLLVYGTMVMRSVLEEKTGRIVEIIVSSLHPWELMLGKIVGVGAVGLTQLAVWLALGGLILLLALPAALPVVIEAGILEQAREVLPGPGVLLFFLLCFLFGYFIYASLFAAIGAMCSTEEEAQQLQFPVIMLVVVPVLFLMPVMDRPDAFFTVALALFPFFSPILMFARVAAGDAALWEIGLSILLMGAALLGTAWVAGRIYRVGILMQGKRPTLPELWRWLREA